jgi:hypothetical protein
MFLTTVKYLKKYERMSFQGIGVAGVIMFFGLICLIVGGVITILTCRGAILTAGCPGGDEIFGETLSKPIAWSIFPIAGVGIVSVIVSVIMYTIQHSLNRTVRLAPSNK